MVSDFADVNETRVGHDVYGFIRRRRWLFRDLAEKKRRSIGTHFHRELLLKSQSAIIDAIIKKDMKTFYGRYQK